MINCKYFTHKKEAEKKSCFNLGRFVTKVARRLFLRLIIRLLKNARLYLKGDF